MLTKQEKVLFANTNLMYCLTPRAENGTMRETFLGFLVCFISNFAWNRSLYQSEFMSIIIFLTSIQ